MRNKVFKNYKKYKKKLKEKEITFKMRKRVGCNYTFLGLFLTIRVHDLMKVN